MNDKLRRIRAPWRRLIIHLVIHTLLWLDQFKSPRAHVHWVGYHHRPRRLERQLTLALFALAFIILETHRFIVWSAAVGSFTSIVVIGLSFYQLIPKSASN